MKSMLLATVCALALPTIAVAQPATNSSAPTTEADTASTDTGNYQGDIIVTATKRSQRLSEVPIAVSAVTGQQLQNSGAVDIRALNQLSPSLLVSSTSTEAGAGGARIRGVGTVGDNAGLESSVATFIDGVYRSRSGVGLTELGAIDRIEVLRGPQGTLFGRNASAGLISITTQSPKFDVGGNAEVSYGNYNSIRIAGGVTGPLIGDKLAGRLDGVYFKRDGFIEDVVSGRDINNRDRYLIRGQLLAIPNDDLQIRLIGDYARRSEECCGANYDQTRTTTRNPDGSLNVVRNNAIANLIRGLGGIVIDTPFARQTALTPGRGYQSTVTDWGISGQVDWRLGDINLTSITAYRDWKFVRGQDADFNSLDLLYRSNFQQQFRTFTQEVRLQGELFDNRVNWLLGGYYANEKLTIFDDLSFGADIQRYGNGLISGFGTSFDAIFAALGRPGFTFNEKGYIDNFRQSSDNWALFTHEEIKITDALILTLGARYTEEVKRLDAVLTSEETGCAIIQPSPFAALSGLPCAINDRVNGVYNGRDKSSAWSGTAVLSYQILPELLTYGSYSRGYKAGGYNLDRAPLGLAIATTPPNVTQLQFAPETVDAFEIGAKYNGRNFNLNAALFYSEFSNFQLNTFGGISFVVENISGCSTALVAGTCAVGNQRPGVVTKGVELEATAYVTDTLQFNGGFTYASTKYAQNLTGFNGRALATPFALLPGSQLSNAPEYVVTGAMTWNPPIPGTNLTGLFYTDFRYQSKIRTGSDLFPEKTQDGFASINGRIGISGPKDRWSVEIWAQNLLNTNFNQVGFNTPLQGSSSAGLVAIGRATSATTLFSEFVGEPRLFGATLRARF